MCLSAVSEAKQNLHPLPERAVLIKCFYTLILDTFYQMKISRPLCQFRFGPPPSPSGYFEIEKILQDSKISDKLLRLLSPVTTLGNSLISSVI